MEAGNDLYSNAVVGTSELSATMSYNVENIKLPLVVDTEGNSFVQTLSTLIASFGAGVKFDTIEFHLHSTHT